MGDQSADGLPINLELLAEFMDEEDETELFDAIDFFVEELPAMLTPLETAIAEQDPGAVRDTAHAAKSAASSIAAMPLFRLFDKIEGEAASENWQTINGMADAVRHEFTRIVTFQRERR